MEKPTVTNTEKFYKLSPSNNLKSSIYFEALDEKLNEKDIRNLAITGGYGTGKSSIIESYITDRNINHTTLRVSLANFCESIKKLEPEDEKRIEEHILQQLFYQLSHEDIPLSSFKKINFWDKKRQRWWIIGAIIWFLFLTLIPNVYKILGGNLKTLSTDGFKSLWSNSSFWGTLFNVGILVGFCYGLFYILNELIRIKQKGQIKKVTLKSAELDLSVESALNKHIDELIYFFETTNNNLVVIEDLDRFESTLLFSKLREVNFMINNSPKVSQNVIFLYAIKDDIFKDNYNRTKFFDFILPVVPVINTTNSGDKLREMLGDESSIPPNYINDISLYIHDYRLLKNIVNEYKVFENRLNDDGNLKPVYIFSLVLYKNIFPQQFSLEHSKKGILYTLFSKNDLLMKDIVTQNNSHIQKLKEERDIINEEQTVSAVKLREEYLLAIAKSNSGFKDICDSPISEMSKEENFDKLFSSPTITFYKHNHSSYYLLTNKSINFENIQNEVNSEKNYKERLDLIEKRKKGKLNDIFSTISDLEQNNKKLSNQKLSSLIKLSGNKKWESVLKARKELATEGKLTTEGELISLLIRKEYINENYLLYMSYFYVGALTIKDFEFLLNVKNGGEQLFDYHLDNPEEILSRINDDEFEDPAAINQQIIILLLDKYNKTNKEDSRLNMIIGQFDYTFEYFEEYIVQIIYKLIDEDGNLQKFVELLIDRLNYSFWDYINEYDDQKKEAFLKLFLHFPNKLIVQINDLSDNRLKDYLTIKNNFIPAFDYDNMHKDISRWLDALQVKLRYTAFCRYDGSKLFQFIYKNSHYELNSEMLRVMLYNKYTLEEEEFNSKFKSQNYSFINYSDPDDFDVLCEYVDNNLNTYFDNIYFNLVDQQNEDEEALKVFLDVYDEDEKMLSKILSKVGTKINDLMLFENQKHWQLLFQKECITPNWNNVLHYYKSNDHQIDNTLVNWLNIKDNYTELSLTSLSNSFDALHEKGISTGLACAIVGNNSICYESYKSLISSLSYYFKVIDLNELSLDKIKFLIKRRKLVFNEFHYDLLIEMEHMVELVEFTTLNIYSYTTKFDDFELNKDLVEKLLDNSKVTTDNKRKIAKSIPLADVNRNIARSIIKLLLAYRTKIPFSGTALATLLSKVKDNDLVIKAIIKFFDYLENKDISIVLKSMGGKYKDATGYNKFPAWQDTKYNREIAYKLEKTGFFRSVKVKEDNIRVRVDYIEA